MNDYNKKQCFELLNTIEKGSKQIIDVIDTGKKINMEKAIRAAMSNSIILVQQLKMIINHYDNEINGCGDDCKCGDKPDMSGSDLPDFMKSFFGGKK